MKRQNKYEYLYVVQGHYGHGWEDLTASEDKREAQADVRAYRENDTAPIRMIKRRVLKATDSTTSGNSNHDTLSTNNNRHRTVARYTPSHA